ncbi:DUF1707 SHOCT-like domain-containing protein [Jiangella rhizosphaerae]|uniref:DUF1707 and DUF2154 domain-containing protein n=1 Tax=Jiangella rhizosphaerae TaxID=2293569 RepID=A0A418KH20_9ACTN|nr:DUF1707 domain-containing protein [Jiangella rhizosphaerae]RIQ11200.1 DUF1707 and DUF2154 domain-containing protein [Jiangella rhizosphaerae]
MDETRDQRALRASDADREQVADVLRQAASDGRLSLTELEERIEALYAAKTYADLEPVLSDLPADLPLPLSTAVVHRAAPAPAPSPSVRVGGVPSSRSAKVVFSGIQRRGDWVVPQYYRVKAVFGGADLDLREATLEAAEVEIDIKAVFGGVNIIVPPDLRVNVDGDGVFGAFNDDTTRGPQPGPGAPVVRITGKAVFGGVNVQRKAAGER